MNNLTGRGVWRCGWPASSCSIGIATSFTGDAAGSGYSAPRVSTRCSARRRTATRRRARSSWDLVTTKFTGFFRHPWHFEVAARHAVEAARRRGRAKLWAAAAATGEEPYSLAAALIEAFRGDEPSATILATDINEETLAVARQGQYGEAALGALTPDQRARFFNQSTGKTCWHLAPEVQRLVEFRALNLIDPVWPIEGPFDVVFCRNVLMYLEQGCRRAVLERMASLLAPDGLLILDPVENLGPAGHLFASWKNGIYSPRSISPASARVGRPPTHRPHHPKPMTIAKRLILLTAVPFLLLSGIWAVNRVQMARVEERIRFVAESRVVALARLGDISRSFAEMRVNVRSFLLATNPAARAAARQAYDEDRAELNRLVDDYADKRAMGDRGRRMSNDFRTMSREWMSEAEKMMSLAAAGREDEATALMSGAFAEHGARLSNLSKEWIQYNEDAAMNAGQAALDTIEHTRRNLLFATLFALALAGLVGFHTFRKIVKPIQALETSVKTIAAGDYTKEVPFTQATDETGGLARSVDVLKQGAEAMDEQRWVKSNASKLTGELQGATSLAEFGQRLVSGLVPVLGGGVSGFYLFEENPGRLRRIAAYGLAEGAATTDSFRVGEGLVGQCAQDRRPATLDHLPPDYLRIASGLGGASPVQAVASPLLSQDTLLGVLEIAGFRAFSSQEKTLLAELLPVVALSFEVLQRNLRTQELLAQTQEQARTLEEQTEELTQSQEELLAQKEELLTQQRELTTQREQLQVTEERTRLILESSAEGIFGTDIEGEITFVNPAACQMLGFAAEELIGQPSHAAFHHHHPDGREYPMEECPMFAAYKHGRASRIDNEFLWRKNGTGLPVGTGPPRW